VSDVAGAFVSAPLGAAAAAGMSLLWNAGRSAIYDPFTQVALVS
jgi:hypothetical protein